MLKLKYIKHRNMGLGRTKKMAKILTVALVVIMLVVGFGVGLISSPFLLAQNSTTDRHSLGKHTENKSNQSRHRPNMATIPI